MQTSQKEEELSILGERRRTIKMWVGKNCRDSRCKMKSHKLCHKWYDVVSTQNITFRFGFLLSIKYVANFKFFFPSYFSISNHFVNVRGSLSIWNLERKIYLSILKWWFSLYSFIKFVPWINSICNTIEINELKLRLDKLKTKWRSLAFKFKYCPIIHEQSIHSIK